MSQIGFENLSSCHISRFPIDPYNSSQNPFHSIQILNYNGNETSCTSKVFCVLISTSWYVHSSNSLRDLNPHDTKLVSIPHHAKQSSRANFEHIGKS
jgi:hypothetical protein